MKYTGLIITGVVASGFAAMFTLQSSDKIVNKKPTIDTTSAIVMVEESNSVEDNFNYDSLNKILDWYENMSPGGTHGYYYELHKFSNLYGELNGQTEWTEHAAKLISVQRYIFDYKDVAKAESKKYGIPAAIILGQGILESNSGMSRLALYTNNHFGIKCFSKTCKKGHCVNYGDDSHKDFFKVYRSVWQSYRDHSEFLMKPRYKHLLKLKKSDYKGWAKGLSKAGYATDKQYAKKLINVIETYGLDKL